MCNKFSIVRNTCSDIWASPEASDLLMDILEAEERCIRDDPVACTLSNVENLKQDEYSYWRCLDTLCGSASNRLVKGRKYFINKLESAHNKFKGL